VAPRRKLLILLPGGQRHRLALGPLLMSFREAPLTGTTLAALVPPELGLDVTLVDGSVSPIPLDGAFDLVAISLITGMALRGYELADHYRARGATVVLGGVHVSLLPDEARRHADAVVIGYAEQTWPQLLRDWAGGRLAAEYRHEGPARLAGLPRPRRDLQKRFGYAMPRTVNATRGCRQVCDFCVAPAVPFGWSTRPVGEVVAEIRELPAATFVFHDLNLTDDVGYAKELFTALRPLRRSWGALVSTRVAKDEELLDLMAASGCSYLLIGFETVSNPALRGMRKGFNAPEHYREVIDALHRRHIVVQGCFIFGLDDDTPEVFPRTVAAVEELRIDIPRYALYTPFPRTHAYQRLKAEGRILHEDWTYYDTQHVVIRPKHMSPAELDRGFVWAWRESFRLRSCARRFTFHRNTRISAVGNLAYRLYGRALKRDGNRFPAAPGIAAAWTRPPAAGPSAEAPRCTSP
jgi:radical SAM superfamily enzyme YgiQ (UPF0313 family)